MLTNEEKRESDFPSVKVKKSEEVTKAGGSEHFWTVSTILGGGDEIKEFNKSEPFLPGKITMPPDKGPPWILHFFLEPWGWNSIGVLADNFFAIFLSNFPKKGGGFLFGPIWGGGGFGGGLLFGQ